MDRKLLFSRMIRNPFFVAGALIVCFIVVVTAISPWIVQYDAVQNSLKETFLDPDFSQGLKGHVLGTDQLGRDTFTRLLIGGRYSLLIAAMVVVLQILIGTTFGILAGYFGGLIDAVIMRMCEIFLAIPNLILAIAIMAVLGPSLLNLVAVLSFSGWVQVCKVTRNNVRVARKQEFVMASRALGAGSGHIMFTQILPNVTTHIIILSSQRFGFTIIVEAALSFLSLGVQPPTPSWGNMISAGRAYMTTEPWLVFAPGIALMLTVLAFNFLGDGLRDVLDPKRV